MNYQLRANSGNLQEIRDWMRTLERTIEQETIPTIADSHQAAILDLTAAGFDAYGYFFHDYGPQQRERRINANKRVDIKDLSFSGDMLASLGLNGQSLTVGDKYQDIALGQMTGHNGQWGYEHVFLATSDETDAHAMDDLEEMLNERLGFN